MGLTQEQFDEVELLSQEINKSLKTAFEQGDPSGELAQNVGALHKKWLCYFWDKYSKEAHMCLTQAYVDDPHFTEYYDKIAVNCAIFLRDVMQIHCQK